MVDLYGHAIVERVLVTDLLPGDMCWSTQIDDHRLSIVAWNVGDESFGNSEMRWLGFIDSTTCQLWQTRIAPKGAARWLRLVKGNNT